MATMENTEKQLLEEFLFWAKMSDKYKGVLSDSEYRKLQDAVAYAEHNLERYLFKEKELRRI